MILFYMNLQSLYLYFIKDNTRASALFLCNFTGIKLLKTCKYIYVYNTISMIVGENVKKLLQDRKTLYLVLCIAVVSVFTLSIAYAAMSTVLEIHGNSEVVASSWDIHLENAK